MTKQEYQFTDRETEALTYLWKRHANKEIFEKLRISIQYGKVSHKPLVWQTEY